MSIYTRTGDDGFTSHLKYGRVSKSSPEIEVEGRFDEAVVAIGSALVEIRQHDALSSLIEPIALNQNRLFSAGFGLFDAAASSSPVTQTDIDHLEGFIDATTLGLPALQSFIIPGGSEASIRLHSARVAIRALERSCHACEKTCGPIEPLVAAYLNRLSDFFFVAARQALNLEGLPEVDAI